MTPGTSLYRPCKSGFNQSTNLAEIPQEMAIFCESQLLIDQKIAEVLESIRLVKSQRNQRVIISKLPPEIMSKIFLEAANATSIFGGLVSPKSRFNFSHVSQYWRNVALSDPSLWARLPDGYPAWCHAMLERSKNVDLVLKCQLEKVGSVKGRLLEDLLTRHGARIAQLEIGFNGQKGGQKLLRCLPIAAPRLRALYCDMQMTRNNISLVPTIPSSKIVDAPLFVLELRNCMVDWQSPLLTGLTELKISSDRSHINASPKDFFDALRRMSSLKVLELKNCVPLDDAPCSSPPPVLHSLKRLRLFSSSQGIIKTIRNLSIPKHASVGLSMPSKSRYHLNATQLVEIAQAIKHFFQLMVGDPKETYCYQEISISSVSEDSRSGYTIQAWSKPCFNAGARNLYTESFDFLLTVPSYDTSLLEAISDGNVRVLTLAQSINPHRLSSLSGLFPLLNTIRLQGHKGFVDSSYELLISLRYKGVDSTEKGHRAVTFPNLEHLIMEDVIFSTSLEDHYIDGEIDFSDFQDCLIERVERGAPIQKLTIEKSYNVFHCYVNEVAWIVPEFHWDGKYYEMIEDQEVYEISASEDEDEDY